MIFDGLCLKKSLDYDPFLQNFSALEPDVLILEALSSNLDLTETIFVSFVGGLLRSRTDPFIAHQSTSRTM